MNRRDDHESRMKRVRWGAKGRLFRAPLPAWKPATPKPNGEGGNVLAAWLGKNRGWVRESEVMIWLAREHGALVEGCVLPEEVTGENAVKALRLVRARLGR